MFRWLRQYSLPVLLAIGLHAGLVLLLVQGVAVESAEARIITPPIVNATLLVVEPKATKPQTQLQEVPKAEPTPTPEPPPKPITPAADKVDPRLLEDKRRRAEQAKKKLALAKKEAERKERERDERKLKERAEAERQRAERIKAAAAKAEKERQERLDALSSSSFSQAVEDEAQSIADAESAEAAASFFQGIRAKIVSNWSRPASARNGMKVTLRVDLVPTGEVVGVSLVDSSGDSAFDRSAELAVRKAGQFEVPSESAVFERRFRRFNLLFNPEDLLR